jgi:hypothetical protein
MLDSIVDLRGTWYEFDLSGAVVECRQGTTLA